jgi:two-component system response regulator AdeR
MTAFGHASPQTQDPTVRGQQSLVLIAEDEPEIAEILMAYLSRSGLRVARAADGRLALDLHLALKPDLVLLDVQMPRLDGWAVLSEIRHRGDTPVIMLHWTRISTS